MEEKKRARPPKHDKATPRKKSGKRGPWPEKKAEQTPATAQEAGEQGTAEEHYGEPLEQGMLAGMEDAAIDELEDAAKKYAGIRDRRMALTKQEVDAQDLVLTLMKRHEKEHYNRDGIEIKIIHESEKAKVTVKKEED